MAPRRPKMAPRGLQGGPRWPHEGSKRAPAGPKRAPRGPKMAPRGLQEGPHGGSKRDLGTNLAQRALPEAPGTLPDPSGERFRDQFGPKSGPQEATLPPVTLKLLPRFLLPAALRRGHGGGVCRRQVDNPTGRQDGLKTAQDGPKTAQAGPNWPSKLLKMCSQMPPGVLLLVPRYFQGPSRPLRMAHEAPTEYAT